MRPLSTSTPKVDSTFLRNVTFVPPKFHLSATPHGVQKRRQYFSLRPPWQSQLSHLFSSCIQHGSSKSKLYYSYNRSQQDALFLNFISLKNFTCFGQIYSQSSGVLILYSQQLVLVIGMLTVCWRGRDAAMKRCLPK